jgi:hypothetical protein
VCLPRQPVVWISIIGGIAAGIGHDLEAIKNGTTKVFATYLIVSGIGVLIGLWMIFRTLAFDPDSGIWAWIWVILGASVGIMVGWWIAHRRLNNLQGA